MREAGDGHPRGGTVAPRTAKHAPHMTAGEPDHVIFPISPQREKQQCTLPIISPAVAATSCGVRGGGGCLKLLVMRAHYNTMSLIVGLIMIDLTYSTL